MRERRAVRPQIFSASVTGNRSGDWAPTAGRCKHQLAETGVKGIMIWRGKVMGWLTVLPCSLPCPAVQTWLLEGRDEALLSFGAAKVPGAGMVLRNLSPRLSAYPCGEC